MRRSAARVLSSTALVVSSALVAPDARAQPSPDDAGAEALFLEGRRLMDAARFDEACAKFAASQKLAPGLGTLMNLADCEEHRGRTATAWAHFREAAAEAHEAGRTERERVA